MKMVLKKLTGFVLKTSLVVALLTLASFPASATPIDQWADTVIDFSSRYYYIQPTSENWGATQALGEPNTFAYGESRLAWAPLPMDGTLEYISLGFDIPVYADGVTIRETLGNGFVYDVDVLNTFGQWIDVWSGIDTTKYTSDQTYTEWLLGINNNTVANFVVTFPETTYLVAGVRIRTNTNTRLGSWEEIDAVQLHGRVPEGGTVIMLALGLLSLAVFGSRFQRRRVS